MFAEYLKEKTWETVMPGVSVCNFTTDQEKARLPVTLELAHAEAFFCISGSGVLHKSGGSTVALEAKEILLLSNCDFITSLEVTSPLEGVVLSVDSARASESLVELCRQLGNLPLSMKRVGDMMAGSGGFRVVPVTPWSRAAFYALKRLPAADRGRYCVLKTFELLYLMVTQETEGNLCQHEHGGSMAAVAASMKKYMEEHMEEKLTITELSHRFHLSRTACKSAFRSCYGQPIHSWLLDRRMERAAELLEHTKLPILQVAQSVGYTGVSQFNVAFRQRYGKSPREYRKMSVSVVF